MSEIQFDINVANGISIDIANDVLPVLWMEVYHFCVYQSESLLHAEIKLFKNLSIKSLISVACTSTFLFNRLSIGSSSYVVVKHLASGARGPGFDSRFRQYNFRDWLSPASK